MSENIPGSFLSKASRYSKKMTKQTTYHISTESCCLCSVKHIEEPHCCSVCCTLWGTVWYVSHQWNGACWSCLVSLIWQWQFVVRYTHESLQISLRSVQSTIHSSSESLSIMPFLCLRVDELGPAEAAEEDEDCDDDEPPELQGKHNCWTNCYFKQAFILYLWKNSLPAHSKTQHIGHIRNQLKKNRATLNHKGCLPIGVSFFRFLIAYYTNTIAIIFCNQNHSVIMSTSEVKMTVGKMCIMCPKFLKYLTK